MVPGGRGAARTRRTATSTSGAPTRRRTPSKEVVFPDQETSIWTKSEPTGEWYLHSFYKEQPDLNVTNPRVRDEIAKIMGFWLELGLSGFRVDAVPFLLETAGADAGAFPDPHEYLRALRALVGRRSGDGILLGEVNLPHEGQLEFFGGAGRRRADHAVRLHRHAGDLPVAGPRPTPARWSKALTSRPALSPDSQWATFVRNHDELTLDKLVRRGAGGGIRRVRARGDDAGLRPRPAPSAAADAGRRPAADPDGLQPAVLAAGHAGALLRRGDRHGGEPRRRGPARRPDADAVDPGRNGGFSAARRRAAARAGGAGGFAPEFVNVADQRRDPDSLLSFMKLLIRRYRESPELGWGDVHGPRPAARRRCWPTRVPGTTGHGRRPQPRRRAAHRAAHARGLRLTHRLVDLLQDGQHPLGQGAVELALAGYGYRWLRVVAEGSRRLV